MLNKPCRHCWDEVSNEEIENDINLLISINIAKKVSSFFGNSDSIVVKCRYCGTITLTNDLNELNGDHN